MQRTLVILVIVLGLGPASPSTLRAAEGTEIQFAFSKSMFADVNEADARAALKVYARTIGEQNGIRVTGEPILLADLRAIASELERGEVDVFGLTTEEFLALESRGLEGPYLCSEIRGRVTEEYLLLAREDGPIRGPQDLRDRHLVLSKDVRNSLAPIWLEVVCREQGLGAPSDLLDEIEAAAKPTQAVLPVFFGQADAAVVTAGSWEILCEMNPQLRRTLRVVLSSPPLVPAFTGFRRGLSEAQKEQIFVAVRLSAQSPAYRQIMALFKADAVGFRPESALDATRVLVATFHRLRSDEPLTDADLE